MAELIAATVVIGDRSYRLKLDPKDELIVRSTIKTVNDKIVEYKTAFAGKDMQDYIAMVLIWLATEREGGDADGLQQTEMAEKLRQIEALIDAGLTSSQP